MQNEVKMTEKKDPNAWIDKERQKIQDEVIRPMREQLEEQIKAIYLQAAQRYYDLNVYGETDVKDEDRKDGTWKFMDCYRSDDPDAAWYRDSVDRLCIDKSIAIADEVGRRIKHEYDRWHSTMIDAITADEDREEREEREWYHRLHDGD